MQIKKVESLIKSKLKKGFQPRIDFYQDKYGFFSGKSVEFLKRWDEYFK